MCLKAVTKRTPRQRAVKVAYKVVTSLRGGRVGGYHRHMTIRCSRWRTAVARRVGSWGQVYDSGFHVFARREDAQRQRDNQCGDGFVVPVTVRGIHTVGEQWGAEVWVAREMFVSVVDVRKARKAAGR